MIILKKYFFQELYIFMISNIVELVLKTQNLVHWSELLHCLGWTLRVFRGIQLMLTDCWPFHPKVIIVLLTILKLYRENVLRNQFLGITDYTVYERITINWSARSYIVWNHASKSFKYISSNDNVYKSFEDISILTKTRAQTEYGLLVCFWDCKISHSLALLKYVFESFIWQIKHFSLNCRKTEN